MSPAFRLQAKIRYRDGNGSIDAAEKRGALIKLLEDALALTDEVEDDKIGYPTSKHSTKHELNDSEWRITMRGS
jgi:hypothetical protein